MSTLSGGPNIVTDGLHIFIDPLNIKSYSGSGTNVFDLSRNGRNMSLINGASVNNGVFALDGTNDYVGYNGSFDWTIIPWTVSFWANATNFTYPTVIDLITAGNGHFRFILFSTFISCSFRTPGGSAVTLISYSITISTGQWYHCAFTRNENNYSAYLNGVLGNTNTSSALNNNARMTVIRIGYSADYDASDRTFAGLVGPVLIYEKTLTSQEILQNYNSTKTRFGL
jgi:hypothetical protein